MRFAMRTFAVAALAAIVVTTASATANATATRSVVRACGLVGRFDGRLYDVRETKGNVPCRRVRTVVTRFFRTGAVRPAPGWQCFRGHSGVPWAVSCSRGSGVVVRVYAPT